MKESTTTSSKFATDSKTEVREVHHYHNDDERIEKRLTGALSLITIGIVLFLNTTGNLDWSVWWEFIKFWPVFIISAGIQLILSFSRPTKIIAEVIGFLLFVMMMFFAAINTNSGIFANTNIKVPQSGGFFPFISVNTDNSAASVQNEQVLASEYNGAKSQYITIDQEVGELSLNVNTDNIVLFSADVKSASKNDGFDLNKKLSDSELRLSLTTSHKANWFMNSFSPKYNYQVTNALPVEKLALEVGAGKGTVNLDNALQVSELKAKTGAGELVINVSKSAVPTTMNLEVGAGNMLVNIDENVAYKVIYKVGIGNIEVAGMKNEAGLGNEDEYKSDNWDTAAKKTTINVNVGVGNFKLKTK